jgi:hypothetical protein
MRLTTLVVCGSCALASTALGATFSIPHVLESSGSITTGPASSAFSGPFSTMGSGESFGPGENGEWFYLYNGPLTFTGTDGQGRSFSVAMEVLSAMSRPEGPSFRVEYFFTTAWTSFNGETLNVPGPGIQASVLSHIDNPLGSHELIFETPVLHFSYEDGGGRTNSLDMGAGQLRIVPAPVSAALFALAGLLGFRRRG